jgi:hypothetical protein
MAEGPQSRLSQLNPSDLIDHARTFPQRFQRIQRYNIQTFRRQPLREISGALGDLGTLLPILIALSHGYISLSSTLVVSGIANILTGIFFGIPLPVQPMKAIAAVALARGLGPEEVSSAGLFVGGVIGVLSITGLMQWFTRNIPIPLIKGIQLGTGLSLIIYGGTLIESEYGPNMRHNMIVILLALLAFFALLGSPMYPRLPFALIIIIVGMVGSMPEGFDRDPPFGFGFWKPRITIPSPTSFRIGAWEAGLGQVPLTTLNSVIAVCFLSADLLPTVEAPSTVSMGLSVMAMNLVGGWFGSMPICHGSGGLAAQYRFGARSGASVVFLGSIKLLLGLFAGDFTQNLFSRFPNGLLSVMVIAAGLELANVGESLNTSGARDLKGFLEREGAVESTVELIPYEYGTKEAKDLTEDDRKRRWATMLITVGGILAFRNDAVGFLAGMLCHWSFMLQDYIKRLRTRREGRIRLNPDSHGESSGILGIADARH